MEMGLKMELFKQLTKVQKVPILIRSWAHFAHHVHRMLISPINLLDESAY
jgi:hypothetical protein